MGLTIITLGRNDLLCIFCAVSFAVLCGGGVLVFSLIFRLWFGKLCFVQQVVDLSVQEGKLSFNVLREQNRFLCWGQFVLFSNGLILPSLQ